MDDLDTVIVAVVDHLAVSPNVRLNLGLSDAAIADAIQLGYIEDREGTLSPTPAGIAYRAGIED